ncbi:hypothetical protein COU57_05935 [Candidatus Pacearchaeota archaeon CG10_big_fil_rev_8_21_14_0_10_32_14]|nr:MAG: hypothetical protein COU57_05935 [Candidatus Pacearchaeota archaeon CG10_big_fil_rev_8_21_14_0_10_32_14]
MKRVLIIKLGALGDVVRSTIFISEFEKDYEIHWLTSQKSKDVLSSQKIKRLYFYENDNDKSQLKNTEFDLVLCLEEDLQLLEYVSKIKSQKTIGHFLNNGKVDYTQECNYWLDMSFVSKIHDKETADKIKLQNKKSVNQIWMEMISGKDGWKSQEYDIGTTPKNINGVIGFIDISESKWPNKFWTGYPDLKQKLEADGYQVISLGMKQTVKEHIEDINNCELVVCGDTSGMHIALALGKKVVAIFNCTPPNEIYDYGRMKKIISPLLEKYFLKRTNDLEAQSKVSINEVYGVIKKLIN